MSRADEPATAPRVYDRKADEFPGHELSCSYVKGWPWVRHTACDCGLAERERRMGESK